MESTTPALAIYAAILKLKDLVMDRLIPDESDQIEVPLRPDLRCREHESLLEAVRLLDERVTKLESVDNDSE